MVEAKVGDLIAGYRIERELGRGGMSVVYLADHERLERKVALKILASQLADNQKFRDRFLRESKVAALDRPPEHRADLRRRRDRRRSVHRDALRGGHRPQAPDRGGGHARRGPHRLDHRAACGRARRGACEGPDPSRREARERAARSSPVARRGRPRLPGRLRADPTVALDQRAHRDRATPRHRGLHRARADQGRSAGRAGRRLRARLRDLRVPDRARPVRTGERGRGPVGPRAGPAARR